MNRAFFCAALLGAAGVAQASEIDLSKGMKELGGSATLNLYAGGGSTQFGIDIAPQAGLFLADNLELLGRVNFGYISDVTTFGVGVGINYYIPTDNFPIYLGALVGFDHGAVGGFTADSVLVSLQGGIVLPVADNMGVDLGLRVNMYFADASGVHIPLGYLGFRSYFR